MALNTENAQHTVVEIEGLDLLSLHFNGSDESPQSSKDDDSSSGLCSESYTNDSIALVRARARGMMRRRMSNTSDFATDSVDLAIRKKNNLDQENDAIQNAEVEKDCLELKQVLKLGDHQAIDVKTLMMSAQVPPPNLKGLQPKHISNSAA